MLIVEVSRRVNNIRKFHLEKSCVDDVEDAVDSEARLGDVGGHDDLPLPLGRLLEDFALRLERHGRVHGQHDELCPLGVHPLL